MSSAANPLRNPLNLGVVTELRAEHSFCYNVLDGD
jgi:hypothetical protein